MFFVIDFVVFRVNKILFVCLRKIGENIDNVEINVIKVI